MTMNDVAVHPAKYQIIFRGNIIIKYAGTGGTSKHHPIRRTHLLRAPATGTTIWPGEFVELSISSEISSDTPLALEPRSDNPKIVHKTEPVLWPEPL